MLLKLVLTTKAQSCRKILKSGKVEEWEPVKIQLNSQIFGFWNRKLLWNDKTEFNPNLGVGVGGNFTPPVGFPLIIPKR